MTLCNTQLGFFLSFGLTVAVLVAAMVQGRRGRTRSHLMLVSGFLVVFVITVFFAEVLGRHYHFVQPSLGIHLTIAITATLGTAAPLVTGYRHLRKRGTRRAHRVVVVIWLALVLAAAGTGLWMLSAGERRNSDPSGATLPVDPPSESVESQR